MMLKYTSSLILLTSCFFIKHMHAAGPLAINITNIDLDPAKVPQIVMRSAAVSNTLHDLELQTPNRGEVVSGRYIGIRNSLGIGLEDVTVDDEHLKIYICSATTSDTGRSKPLFSVSEEATSLAIQLRQGLEDTIIAVLTTIPPDLISLNMPLQIPLGGIPFQRPEDTSDED